MKCTLAHDKNWIKVKIYNYNSIWYYISFINFSYNGRVRLNVSNIFPFSSCLCPLIHQSNFNSRQFSLVRFKKIIALKLSNTWIVPTRQPLYKRMVFLVRGIAHVNPVKKRAKRRHRFHESAANSTGEGEGEGGRGLRISCGHVAFGGPVYRLRHIRFPPFFLRVLSSFSSSASLSARLCSDGKTLTSR